MKQVNIIGRVGGEVDLRYTPSGKTAAALTLAVDDDGRKTSDADSLPQRYALPRGGTTDHE